VFVPGTSSAHYQGCRQWGGNHRAWRNRHGGPDAEIQRPALNDIWAAAKLDELLPKGMTRAELILRYTLSHPHCDTAIIGTCDEAHLAENLTASAGGPLVADLLDEITARVRGVDGQQS